MASYTELFKLTTVNTVHSLPILCINLLGLFLIV